MRRNEFAVAAVVALLLLGGCTGGGSTAPSTTTEVPAATTTATNGETATTTTTATATTGGPTTTPAGESATTGESDRSGLVAMFDSFGAAKNYSADGALDVKQVARAHLRALKDVESVTVRTSSLTKTANGASVQHSLAEYNATHEFYRQQGTGLNVTVYDGPELNAMKVGGENGPEHFRILGENETEQSPKIGNTSVLLLAKLQTMPYEKVGTVQRNGTTLTKYEATGPGYYATKENLTVESFDSTLLVDRNGLVRYFHHEITYQHRGQTRTAESTLRYSAVGTTEVTIPEWLDEVRGGDEETSKAGESSE